MDRHDQMSYFSHMKVKKVTVKIVIPAQASYIKINWCQAFQNTILFGFVLL